MHYAGEIDLRGSIYNIQVCLDRNFIFSLTAFSSWSEKGDREEKQ